MSPATTARTPRGDDKLLLVDPANDRVVDARSRDLPSALRPGDLLVVNDAATYPASLVGETAAGEGIEARLHARTADGAFRALLFGVRSRAELRARTEDRSPPPSLAVGSVLALGTLTARVVAVDPRSPRLVTLRFDADERSLWRGIYASGTPIQYAYVEGDLAPWDVQTTYASRPWAAEMPSAGRPLRGAILLALARRGVRIAALTHAAGLSSTGDPALDALLPMPERYSIGRETAVAIAEARAHGGRVIAVGTTVVRALEGSAVAHGRVMAEEAETSLVIGPGFVPRVVDGLLTGMHEPTASHYALLQAFAPRALLDRAYALAERAGYLGHEFGDASLILADLG